MQITCNDNYNYPLSCNDRKYFVINAYNGDTITIKIRCTVADVAAGPENSNIIFVLRDHRFSLEELWRGIWHDGIEEVPGSPGLICITIPASISGTLRRGSYIFSVSVSDLLGDNKYTATEGMLQIEYAPTSDTNNIPYK